MLRPQCTSGIWFCHVRKGSPPAGPQRGVDKEVPALSLAHLGSGVIGQVIQLMLSPYKGWGPSVQGEGSEACLSEDTRWHLERQCHPSQGGWLPARARAHISDLSPPSWRATLFQGLRTGLGRSLSSTHRPTWEDIHVNMQGQYWGAASQMHMLKATCMHAHAHGCVYIHRSIPHMYVYTCNHMPACTHLCVQRHVSTLIHLYRHTPHAHTRLYMYMYT